MDWHTVRLVDCPLVQRLRGVRQLGLTYLTFPTGDHSRFVHSLGMTCVVNRFLQAMSTPRISGVETGDFEWYKIDDRNPAPDFIADSLRHAALLHDCGHMPFSHASERIFHGNPNMHTVGGMSVSDFLFLFEDILGIRDPKFAECLSIALILSPRFHKFYFGYVLPDKGRDPYRIHRIACLILGNSSQDRFSGTSKHNL